MQKTLDVSYSDSEEGTVLRKSILGKYIQVRYVGLTTIGKRLP